MCRTVAPSVQAEFSWPNSGYSGYSKRVWFWWRKAWDFLGRKFGHPPGDMVHIPHYLQGLGYIQTVVGLGISEASTVSTRWFCWWPFLGWLKRDLNSKVVSDSNDRGWKVTLNKLSDLESLGILGAKPLTTSAKKKLHSKYRRVATFTQDFKWR